MKKELIKNSQERISFLYELKKESEKKNRPALVKHCIKEIKKEEGLLQTLNRG